MTEEEFREWLELPVTRKVFKVYQLQADLAKEVIVSGGCSSDTMEKTGTNYYSIIKYIDAYQKVQQVDYQDILDMETYFNEVGKKP